MKVIEVEWLDAGLHAGWASSHEDAHLLEVYSCGYLIYEDEDVVKIALNHSGNTIFAGVQNVPKSAIRRRRRIAHRD